MTTSAHLICDDEFEIVRITPDMYDEVTEFYYKYFMHYENICIAVRILESADGSAEIKRLLRYVLEDGLSFAIRCTKTKKIVAISCNKVVNPSKHLTFDEMFKTFKSASMLSIGDYLDRMENTYDIFKEWQLDSVLEIEFIAVDRNYGKRGFGSKITEHSLEFARRMCHGNLSAEEKHSIPAHLREEHPKAAVSVFTTIYTQKIGTKFGFEALNTMSHKEFHFEGVTYADRIGPEHESSVYAGLRL